MTVGWCKALTVKDILFHFLFWYFSFCIFWSFHHCQRKLFRSTSTSSVGDKFFLNLENYHRLALARVFSIYWRCLKIWLQNPNSNFQKMSTTLFSKWRGLWLFQNNFVGNIKIYIYIYISYFHWKILISQKQFLVLFYHLPYCTSRIAFRVINCLLTFINVKKLCCTQYLI